MRHGVIEEHALPGARVRLRARRYDLWMYILCVAIAGCNKPTLTSIEPNKGYPRQLLGVSGGTEFAAVVWDVGSVAEVTLYTSPFGTRYFQVPEDAPPGQHQVALRNAAGTSDVIEVTVLAAQPFPEPRIEDIGILNASGTPLSVAFTVAAANLDVDAALQVRELTGRPGDLPQDRTVSLKLFWSGLPVNYLQDHQPGTFGYPVYHYAQVAGVVDGVSWGSTLQVTVVNTDGQTATRDIPLPSSASELDGDGDGLHDAWEESGYTAPSGSVISLSNLGADKWRKDIFLEVDWIDDAKLPDVVFTNLEAAFAGAPVLNPDGSAGIHLMVDRGQAPGLSGGTLLADHECITLEFPPPAPFPGCSVLVSLFTYKMQDANFNPDRLSVFHYAVLGRKDVEGGSGRGEWHGNDFYVTNLGFGVPAAAIPIHVGTLMHELGHNLGLSHGDLMSNAQKYRSKVNLPSVMNYRYVAGVDVNCDVKPDPGRFSYSQGTLESLNESFVDENVGVCDKKPVDFNKDMMFSAGPMNLNPGSSIVDDQDSDTLDSWDDFDQWGHLLLRFVGGAAWNNN